MDQNNYEYGHFLRSVGWIFLKNFKNLRKILFLKQYWVADFNHHYIETAQRLLFSEFFQNEYCIRKVGFLQDGDHFFILTTDFHIKKQNKARSKVIRSTV